MDRKSILPPFLKTSFVNVDDNGLLVVSNNCSKKYDYVSKHYFTGAFAVYGSIEIPDNVSLKEIVLRDLPQDWPTYPAPLKLADIGTEWARTKETLLLRVPSAIVPREYNILINPQHPDMPNARIIDV